MTRPIDHPRRSRSSRWRALIAASTAGLLAAASLLIASPAQAAVTVLSTDLSASCYNDLFRIDGSVNGVMQAGDSVEIYLRVDGQISGETYHQTAISDNSGFGIGLATPFISDDADHFAELVVNGEVVASDTYSYLTSCNPQPIPATATFGDPVCTDDSASATVSVDLAEGRSPEFIVTAETSVGTETYSGAPPQFGGHLEFIVPLATNGSTIVTVTEQYRPTLTAPIGSHTYVLPDDCDVDATPTTPTPTTPTPTPTPTDTAMPTPSPTPSLSASLSPGTVVPGGQVTISAGGFAADEEFEIWLHSTPVKLATGIASESGTVSPTVIIPVGTELGAHQIEVRGAASGSVWLDLTVTSSRATAGLDRTGTGSLAATGLDNTGIFYLAGGALGLLAAGSAVLLVLRRRQTHTNG